MAGRKKTSVSIHYLWSNCSVLNKLTLLTYQYETKQEDG